MDIDKINELYYQSRKILKENRNDELTMAVPGVKLNNQTTYKDSLKEWMAKHLLGVLDVRDLLKEIQQDNEPASKSDDKDFDEPMGRDKFGEPADVLG